MYGKDIATLSAQDEARYMRAMQEREDNERKKEEQQRLRVKNDRDSNL